MTSFSSRNIQIWKSSAAETLPRISGVFAFEIIPSIMVIQGLQFLFEEAMKSERFTTHPIISGFIAGMRFYSSERANQLLYWKDFKSSSELFDYDFAKLQEAVQQLESHMDVNITFNRVTYLAGVGTVPTQPILIFERVPFQRVVGFEVEERGLLRSSFISGDFEFSKKAKAAQHHYSTGLVLLAAEDQIPGLIDGSFVQFYLAIECILDAHGKDNAKANGEKFFGNKFTSELAEIVEHVYLARHCFFGHGHPNQQIGQIDTDAAFKIAKQTLVARWCARKLISIELGRDLLTREMRLYQDFGGSVGFNGSLASLSTDFALPK